MNQSYEVETINKKSDALLVQQFLLSGYAFDDPRPTPGEKQYFEMMPYNTLEGECVYLFVRDQQGTVIACIGYTENEEKTGGYHLNYLAVHRDCRMKGLAMALYQEMLVRLKAAKARYLLTYTCDLELYKPARRLFEGRGFVLTGRCPDYYYDGEDRLIYYLKLQGADSTD